MNAYGPGTKFSLLCHLDLHWPMIRYQDHLQPGADPSCGEYLEASKDMNYDEHMRFFCSSPLTEKARTKDNRQLRVKHFHSIDNLRTMCHKWLKKYPKPGSANAMYYANLPYGPNGPK